AVEKGSDEAVRGTCAWAESVVFTWTARWDEARAATAKAEAIAERLGDRQDLEQYRLIAMMACFWMGDLEGALRCASFVARSAEERGDIRNLGLGMIGAIFVLARLGRFDEAEERQKRLSALSLTEDTELGRDAGRALLLCCRG